MQHEKDISEWKQSALIQTPSKHEYHQRFLQMHEKKL